MKDYDCMMDKRNVSIILFIAMGIAYQYHFSRNIFDELDYHSLIINGEAVYPFSSRILVPFLKGFIAKYLGEPATNGVYLYLSITMMLIMFYQYLRTIYTSQLALIGMLLMSSILYMIPEERTSGMITETALWSAGLICIKKRYYWLLGIVSIVAITNRQSGLFIPVASILILRDWKSVLVFCVSSCTVIFLPRSPIPPGFFMEVFNGNWQLSSILTAIVRLPQTVILIWMALLSIPKHDEETKRTFLIVPIYLTAMLIHGCWNNVRLYLPMYPILISMGLKQAWTKDVRRW